MKKLRLLILALIICLSFSVPVLAVSKSDVVIEGVHTSNAPVTADVNGQEVELNKSIASISSPESVDVGLTLKSYRFSAPKTGDSGIVFPVVCMAICSAAIVGLLRKRGTKAALSALLAISVLSPLASAHTVAYAEAAALSYTVTESFSNEMLEAFTFDKFVLNNVAAETIKDSNGTVTGITWKTDGTAVDQGVSYRLLLNGHVPDELMDKEITVSKAVLTFTAPQGKSTTMEYPDVSILIRQVTEIEPEPEIPLAPSPDIPDEPAPPIIPPTIPPTNPPTPPPVVHFTLTYNANGGSGSDVVLSVPSGASAEIASNMFERLGHTFAFWNTQPDGSGETYIPGEMLAITSNVTLYAQWTIEKSAPPVINQVYEGAAIVTGTGIPGSIVTVKFPTGVSEDVAVNPSGDWSVDVPSGVMLYVGEVVAANQREPGKMISDTAYETVIRGVSIDRAIDIYVENLTTGLNHAVAGDTLLCDIIVSNEGAAVWTDAYATIYLDGSVNLLESSIRINNKTTSQYNYDSAANALTLYLGDIPGGAGCSIGFRVSVKSDISNIDDIILDTELGSL